MIYKKYHPEPFIFDTDYFSKNDLQNKDPWDSNQAIPYLIFFKHVKIFNEMFRDKLNIIKKEKLSFLLYPASGGFENKAMIPDALIPLFKGIEYIVSPFKDILAFRCFIVLEKI
ncbi:MAG: hypothetical protein IPL53_09855 [Ignavibacteria bacterium]|nr:hypothetical protein [Ignavibacteria bacterium]